MADDYFVYKIYCEFTITSNEVTPEMLTEELDFTPHRTFKKGEKSISSSGAVLTKPHNLWAIKSETIISHEEEVSKHISFLKDLIGDKLSLFQKCKGHPKFESSFWIWIETDNGGLGLDLKEDEIQFINDISNRLHISLIFSQKIS